MTEEYKTWTSPSGGKYRVSNKGHVHRNHRDVWCETGLAKNSGSYRNFGGSKNGTQWNKPVHRIVAELFIPNPDNLPEVDHRDGDRLNNCVDNLRWATRRQNAENRRGRGCHKKGSRWVSRIGVRGKMIHLGTFDTEEEAHACYLGAKATAHAFWSGR